MRCLLALAFLLPIALFAQAPCPGAIGSDVDRDGIDDFCDASYDPPIAPNVPNPGYGPRRVLVAHFKFPDWPVPFAVEETRERLAGTHPFSVAEFFAEVSYGATSQTFDVKPWVDLPHERAYYQNGDFTGGTLVSDALNYVGDHYDLRNVDVVMLMLMSLDSNFPGRYAFVPPGTPIGRSGVVLPVAIMGGSTLDDTFTGGAAHELGHTYGFLHTSEILCRTWTWAIPETWTDPYYNSQSCGVVANQADALFYGYAAYDMMGNLNGHPNAFLKTQAGWLKTPQLVQSPAGGSYVLDQYEVASEGVKAAQIPYGADIEGKPVSLWIEYRAKPLVNLETHAIETDWPNDRVVIWVNLPDAPGGANSMTFTFNTNGTPNSNQPDGMLLPAGGTFKDPYRGVRVTRGADSSVNGVKRASVSIERSGLRFDPAIGIKLGPQNPRFVRVTNGGDSAVVFGAVRLKGRSPSLFRIASDTCSGATLLPGAECSVAVGQQRFDGSFNLAYAHLEFSTNDPLWPSPTIGLVGDPSVESLALPEAPAIGAAVAGEAAVSVAFSPRTIGDGTLVQYTAVCTGGIANTGTFSPIVVHGLTPGAATKCMVKTTSTLGDSAWSAASKPVTPLYGPRRRAARS